MPSYSDRYHSFTKAELLTYRNVFTKDEMVAWIRVRRRNALLYASRFGLVVSLLVLLANAVQTTGQGQQSSPSASAVQQADPARVLTLGQVMERELKGDERHSYQINLAAGQILHAIVDQRGLEVVTTLFAPDGKKVDAEFNFTSNGTGPVGVIAIAEITGAYRLEVGSVDRSATGGRYEVKIEELRAATEQDMAQLTKLRSMRSQFLEKTQKIAQMEEADRLEKQALQIFIEGVYSVPLSPVLRQEYYKPAVSLAERASALRERTLGAEHPKFAGSLLVLATLYMNAGDYALAEQRYLRALSIYERSADQKDTAGTLLNLVTMYTNNRDYARAEQAAQRALTIYEKKFGREHSEIAVPLHSLATVYLAKGDYGQAEQYFQRILTLNIKSFGPEHREVASTLQSLAQVYLMRADQEKAEQYLQRSIWINEKQLGVDHPSLAAPLSLLAQLYVRRGDFALAEQIAQRVLKSKEKTLGPNHAEIATFLDFMGGVYREKGEYVRAEPYFQRGLEMREKVLGPEDPEIAKSLGRMSWLYEKKGDYARAEQLVQRALAINRKRFGPEHPAIAGDLNLLARLYYMRKDYATAEKHLQHALVIEEQAIKEMKLNSAASWVNTTLNNLAFLYEEKGDYARAEEFFRRSLTNMEKEYDPESYQLASHFINLARLHRRKGEYAPAEEHYKRALALSKPLGAVHPDLALIHLGLATLYEAKGDTARAVESASRAAEIREHNLALTLAAGSEREKLLYTATLSNETNSTISLHIRSAPNDPQAARLALTTILRRKGRTLDAMTDQIGALRRRLNHQDRLMLDSLSKAQAQFAALAFSGPRQNCQVAMAQKEVDQWQAAISSSGAKLAGYTTEGLQAMKKLGDAQLWLMAMKVFDDTPGFWKAAEAQVAAASEELSARSAEFRAQAQAVTIEEVQKTIPAGTALVEIVSYEPVNAKTAEHEAARYAAYILQRAGAVQWKDLGEAETIDRSVGEFRKALVDADSAETDVKQVARTLDERVMRPVRRLLGKTKQLLISPDGQLNLIPFAALVDEQNRYLVEGYSISYLTSGRDLARLQVKSQSSAEPVIVGNPLFDETRGNRLAQADERRAVRSGDSLSNFEPLSGTAGEVQALSSIIAGAKVLIQAGATEAAIKRMSGPTILHVATHGFFLPDQKEEPSALHASSQLEMEDCGLFQAEATYENPLLRSGLALAGANQRRGGEGEDGILTALEAAGLDLWGTQLVVLSACKTGVGEVRNGEGVYGLRRALVLAGAESQVMSLWRVHDVATSELMVGYYKRLQAGAGRGEALRQVQLGMLANKERSHPYYWAGFIQSGEWKGIHKANNKKTGSGRSRR